MNLDALMDKEYDAANYNCAHFVCDVFKTLGIDGFNDVLAGYLCAERFRGMFAHRKGQLRLAGSPVGICLALFQGNHTDSHVGVLLEGKILHLTESGVNYVSVEDAMAGFTKVRFYCAKTNHDS